MKKAIRMSSIPYFKTVVHNIKARCDFNGWEYPVILARSSVKLHGTNSSVAYNNVGGFWTQSKEAIITPSEDNAGFSAFANQNEADFMAIINVIQKDYQIDLNTNTIVVYGEWVGKGIQNKVAVSLMEKTFFIYGVKIAPFDDSEPNYWVDACSIVNGHPRIYNIHHFSTQTLTINLNQPEIAINDMYDMMMDVEAACPVGKFFGFDGHGEGVVFTTQFMNQNYFWKIKGKKHAGKSKIKKAKKVNIEKLNKINDLLEDIVPEWRLQQMFDEVTDRINGGKPNMKQTGDFIRRVQGDIIKEEMGVIIDAELTWKDVSWHVSKKAQKWWLTTMKEEKG